MANRLIFETALDGSGFSTGLNRLSSAVGGFKNLLVGAFGAFSITQAVRGTIEWASELRDSADALGVNVEWLQKMQNGAQLVGGDIQDVTKFINEMNRARGEAINKPTGANAQAFGRLGFSGGDISGLSTQAFTQKLVSAFAGGATTQMVNDLQEVGGRSARNLIAAFSTQFASDTPILAEELIDQLDDIGDKFTVLKTTMMVELAPAITAVAKALMSVVAQFKQFGSLLGGFFGNLGAGDIAKLILTPGAFAASAKGQAAIKAAQAAVVSEEADQTNMDDMAASAGKAAGKARKQREGAPPVFTPDEIKLAALKTPKATIATDALVSVGNFLGSNRGMIEGLAQKQVDLLTRIELNTRRTPETAETVYPP